MPVWGAVSLAIVVALITQIGTLVIQNIRLSREDAKVGAQREHESREHRREEWHRNLRWAADHIAEESETHIVIGVRTLDVLDDEPGLTREEQAMIDAILKGITVDLGGDLEEIRYHDDYDEDGRGDEV